MGVSATKIDTLKAVITYLTIAVIALGGLAAIIVFNMDPDKLAIVAGLVGAALQFLTTGETATRTARSISSAQTAGSDSMTPTNGNH